MTRRARRTSLAALLCTLALPLAAQEVFVVTTTAEHGEGSLRAALAAASAQAAPAQVVIFADGEIAISETLHYAGRAPLAIFGNATRITATQDITLFSATGGGDLYLRNLAFDGPGGWGMEQRSTAEPGRGIHVVLPPDRSGLFSLELESLQVTGTAGHGIHVTDCAACPAAEAAQEPGAEEDAASGAQAEVEAGAQAEVQAGAALPGAGAAASLALRFDAVEVRGTGRGRFGTAGVLVEEHGPGDLSVVLNTARIAENGGTGLSLREAGEGGLILRSFGSAFEMNGDFCASEQLVPFLPDPAQASFEPGMKSLKDLPAPVAATPEDACFAREVRRHEDGSVASYRFAVLGGGGVHVVETGPGSLDAVMERAGVIGNLGTGLDLGESGPGDLRSTLIGSFARDSGGDAYRQAESGAGGLFAALVGAVAEGNDGRGLVFTEAEAGALEVQGYRLRSQYNMAEGAGVLALQGGAGVGIVNLRQSQIADRVEGQGVEVVLDQ